MHAEISLHYEGAIAKDNQVSLRVLGGALNNLQSAIDRAVLDVKYGSVWKHARLKNEDYPLAEFEIKGFREGSFIADFKQKIETFGPQIVNRIRDALVPGHSAALDSCHQTYDSLATQAELRKRTLSTGALTPLDFESFLNGNNREIQGQYGDRSILKEIDQLLTPIRNKSHPGSTLEIIISTEIKTDRMKFNEDTAKNFHRIVSTRRIGKPLFIEVLVRSLDQGNNFQTAKGKLKNLSTDKDFNLHIGSEIAFNSLLPYLVKGELQQKATIIACPVLEYDSFDPYGGDMYFLKLA